MQTNVLGNCHYADRLIGKWRIYRGRYAYMDSFQDLKVLIEWPENDESENAVWKGKAT